MAISTSGANSVLICSAHALMDLCTWLYVTAWCTGSDDMMDTRGKWLVAKARLVERAKEQRSFVAR